MHPRVLEAKLAFQADKYSRLHVGIGQHLSESEWNELEEVKRHPRDESGKWVPAEEGNRSGRKVKVKTEKLGSRWYAMADMPGGGMVTRSHEMESEAKRLAQEDLRGMGFELEEEEPSREEVDSSHEKPETSHEDIPGSVEPQETPQTLSDFEREVAEEAIGRSVEDAIDDDTAGAISNLQEAAQFFARRNKHEKVAAVKKAMDILQSEMDREDVPVEPEQVQANVETPPGSVEPGSAKDRVAVAKAAVLGEVPAAPAWFRKKDPHVQLAEALAQKLDSGEQITAAELFHEADAQHGGTRAEGTYGQSEAYDSLEAAVNRHIEHLSPDATADFDQAVQHAEELGNIVDQLPTQTNRSGNKESFQQFSTPPNYAFAVAWLAGINPGDSVLEPSAGTGSLAVHAKNAGADVYVNELDPRRAEFLKEQFGPERVSIENAEQIAGILPGRGIPQVDEVVMNPPFSQTAGRLGDKKDLMVAANHIAEAGMMLKPGGRLVSIVGRGMSPDSNRYRSWFKQMEENGYHLKANVLVSGDVYKKYGTHFDSRVLVFDKDSGETGEPVTGEVGTVPELMAKLKGIRDERADRTGGGSTEPAPQIAESVGQSGPEPSHQHMGADQVEDAEAGLDAGDTTAAGHAGGTAGPGTGPEDGGLRTSDVPSSMAGDAAIAGPGANGSGTPGEAGTGGGNPERKPRRAAKLAKGSGPADWETAAGQSGGQSGKPAEQLRPATPLTIEQLPPHSDETNAELTASLYEPYKPQRIKIAGASEHPTPLVESAAMASVQPPEATYQPHLSPDIPEKGILSEAQLESVVYAGQAHQTMLPAGDNEPERRRGYFIGDGTGAAKGRQIAGIIEDNWNQGRKKAVWVSKSRTTLFKTSQRDWSALGHPDTEVMQFSKMRDMAEQPKEGVAYLTYDTLKSKPRTGGKEANIDALVKWLGPDFDGVIAFDESHLMANATARKGSRGTAEPSLRALAGLELQNRLPKARVVYSSATGATEVANLAYADRLGIWGPGTAFPTREDFIQQMDKGGVAAMEAVAQSLKATGNYASRSLTFDDGTPQGQVTYDRLTHHLADHQKQTYDDLAEAWQNVLQNVDKALDLTGGQQSGQGASAARSQFWGGHQRFFNQIITAMQTPAVINAMEKDIAEGRAPVVQLVNTMEAATTRGIKNRTEDQDIEDIDVSPREVLARYLDKSFPTERYEQKMDSNGNITAVPVMKESRDEQGNVIHGPDGKPLMEHVHDPAALKLKEELLSKVGGLHIPESPLDQIINHFGHEKVAEATGRSVRIVKKNTEKGREKVIESRNPDIANVAESSAFQNGQKDIMIFSDAGGTGVSYHASRKAKNQKQRVHYMLQPGWRADAAVQGIGRTHRTNQSVAPTYRLVEIGEIPGQKRFISTIARRLDQLGALTRGQRQAGGGGMFSAMDNLESKQAHHAVQHFFDDLERGKIPGLNHQEVMEHMGLAKEKDKAKKREGTGKKSNHEDVTVGQFLNRLLSLKLGMQNDVFNAFEGHLQQEVERAILDGTLDNGVENFKAHSIERATDNVIHRDSMSGAEVRHIVAKVKNKADRRSWEDITKAPRSPEKFVTNNRSGQVWAVYPALDKTDATTGRIEPQVLLRGPGTSQYRAAQDVEGWRGPFSDADHDEAQQKWQEQYKKLPEFTESDAHFVTGALLPVWNRLPNEESPKIRRVRFADGQTVVGRLIHPDYVEDVLKKFGHHAMSQEHSPQHVHRAVQAGTHIATLANGWKLKPVRRQNEERIQITGPGSSADFQALRDAGAIPERINYQTQWFVPMGSRGADVVRKLTTSNPVTELQEKETERYSKVPVPAFLLPVMRPLPELTDEARIAMAKAGR